MPAKKDYNVPKDELYELYIVQNKMTRELAGYYHIPFGSFVKIIRKYGFKKDKEAVKKNIQRSFDERGADRLAAAHQKCKDFTEKYGYHPSQKPEVIEKRNQTNIDKYGCENPFGNSEIKEKIKNKIQDLYGAESAGASKELQRRSQQAIKDRYGVNNYGELALSESARDILSSAEKLRKYIIDNNFKTVVTAANAIGCGHCTLCRRLNKYELWDLIDAFGSHYEEEVSNFLDEIGVRHYKTKFLINPYEIDAYCPDHKIGIEFNGDYWHSIKQKENDYHLTKYNKAKPKDIFIFYIYEFEWIKDGDKIKQQIKDLLNNNYNLTKSEYIIENGKIPEKIMITNGYKCVEELPPKKHISGPYEVYDAGYKHWVKI